MESLKPAVKWVGGKRQLLPEIHSRIPEFTGKYVEPFLGGGAVLFSLIPESALAGDSNQDLVNLYKVIKDTPQELIDLFYSYPNEKDFYYEIRAVDRDAEVFDALTSLEKAARFLYLNRACFNGLYRVNSKGHFNAAFASYKNLSVDNDNILKMSEYLNNSDVSIVHSDYKKILEQAVPGDFVYLDPPYDPVNPTSNFTSYSKDKFSRENQEELKSLCDTLDDNGVKFMLSNSATDFMKELYSDFTVNIVSARRVVNSKASKRGAVEEILVTNYNTP